MNMWQPEIDERQSHEDSPKRSFNVRAASHLAIGHPDVGTARTNAFGRSLFIGKIRSEVFAGRFEAPQEADGSGVDGS